MSKAVRGEVLVALLKEKSDFHILQEHGWYRIPVASAPKRWPPRWLAFYQPKALQEEAFRVHLIILSSACIRGDWCSYLLPGKNSTAQSRLMTYSIPNITDRDDTPDRSVRVERS